MKKIVNVDRPIITTIKKGGTIIPSFNLVPTMLNALKETFL